MDAREIMKGTVVDISTKKPTEEQLLYSAVSLLRKIVKNGREINCVPAAADTLNRALTELFALRKQIGTMPQEMAAMVARLGGDVVIPFLEMDELMAAGKQLRYHVDKDIKTVNYTIEELSQQPEPVQ